MSIQPYCTCIIVSSISPFWPFKCLNKTVMLCLFAALWDKSLLKKTFLVAISFYLGKCLYK